MDTADEGQTNMRRDIEEGEKGTNQNAHPPWLTHILLPYTNFPKNRASPQRQAQLGVAREAPSLIWALVHLFFLADSP